MKAYGITLEWDIISLLARPARIAAARTHAESVDLDVAWQEWLIAQSAKSAAWKLLSLEAQRQVAHPDGVAVDDRRRAGHVGE